MKKQPRILNIVSSNVITDPRVQKQIETIKEVTNDYLIIGRSNSRVTNKRLKKVDYNLKLFGKAVDDKGIINKIMNRAVFGLKTIFAIWKFKPDIIHANDFDTLFISKISNYKRAKIIFDAHEIYSKNSFINTQKWLSLLVQVMEKNFLKKKCDFITVSNSAKQYYIENGYPIEPVVVTNVPILKDNSNYNFDNSNSFKVIYQGQIVKDRGYEEFVMSSKLLEDSNIELVVRGFGLVKNDLIEMKIEESLNNLRIEDPVEYEELVESLTNNNLGVVLTKPISDNYKYTVSNKIFEYIHAGLPVLLSPLPEHKYLNEKYDFGLILEDVTPDEIAKSILYLYKNPLRYKELKKNAENAKEKLNWQRESRKLKKLYLNY